MPFVKQPPKVRFQNNKSALSAAEFVTKEIKDLLKSGCIKEIDESEAHVISPLSVVHKSTKPRLILDLSYLNQFLTVPKFKFEDIRSVKDLFRKGDYFFKFDIHKGYYHINIFEPHVKYLAFFWIIDGQVTYFAYTVLVFGLSPAPFVFTKVVKVLIKHWRSSGIRIFGFVDDVFGGGRSFDEAQEILVLVRQDLADSGFLENTEKSVWVPCQRGQHLGYIVDLQKGIFSVTPARIDKLGTHFQRKVSFCQIHC